MAGGSTEAVLSKDLLTLYQAGAVGALTDGQLLDRFVLGPDETAGPAFAVLVERHGPMVLRVCRQTLGDSHDAQDAFQATFLVLVRKAGSVRNRDSLASWLHGVARRVAMRAKGDAARRRSHERRVVAAAQPAGDGGRPESWPELHEEIARLPEKYRAPVVLCYLEGLSTEAASRRLGCPQGTVLSRLSRGREQLRKRLTQRGLAMPAGVPAPALPTALLGATVRASLEFARCQATGAALVSTTAATLARGVLFTMTVSKLKVLGAAALACVLTLGGARGFARQFGGASAAEKPAEAQPASEHRQLVLSHALNKLQAELDETARRNTELRKELDEIRAELKALREGPREAARGPMVGFSKSKVQRKDIRAFVNRVPGLGDQGGGAPEPPRVSEHGKSIIMVSPLGDKVKIYNRETKQTRTVRMEGTKESPLEVIPIVGPGVVALMVKGPKITRIAAAGEMSGPWHTLELREPVEGAATPIVGPGVVAYGLGRYVYAFSPETGRWDVLKVPEGVPAQPIVGPGSVGLRGGGHIYSFSAKTGKWSDLDLNAILNADDEDKGEDDAKPGK